MEVKAYTSWGKVSSIGRRPTMEDAIWVSPNLLKYQDSPMHFFAVYDGHGGSEVAVYSSMRFHEILARHWDAETLIEDEKMKELLVRSFEELDRELPSVKGYREDIGSTALVALVSTSDIFVANIGDSRAVLCRTTEVLPLSDDHKPDRADEQKRIEDLDGLVLNNEGARVFGVLAMSRSLGKKINQTIKSYDSHILPFFLSYN
ncbi:hypothetical protein OSB04_015203 [Centaurea solstitialis]|uniref:protein-serine/threonine phosphatase n=1 Tax=Centaurea solstitialis TaxID=347529 RepID=A0AA38SYQ8_9ASTR|nr:hypothetical protein OSB04_015203 [Centaurea solstitialis]